MMIKKISSPVSLTSVFCPIMNITFTYISEELEFIIFFRLDSLFSSFSFINNISISWICKGGTKAENDNSKQEKSINNSNENREPCRDMINSRY
mmetsp:Transcript_33688/g.33173  ORF Transcript_33688/g.33173 Transcript_33688/m.33173 type:complete len:94 (+) Transcript_33688:1184-1465(+)